MPGTSSAPCGPTVTVTLVRLGIRSCRRSLVSVILPTLGASVATVRRLMSPAGTLTSKVSVRRTSMPPGPVTRSASFVRPTSARLELNASRLRSPAAMVTERSKPGWTCLPGAFSNSPATS